ncbi:undecaprenyl-phosphate glucose phosphotransferase [Butyrivibrio sp. VCD2006]|uniref:undecaprenyl-phosphate glucose phosphotransferase n=1 Tax=Butyrivibrio sp. VCD2006 TaxID=1280664 RepID=UPI00047AD248|nr:undecaprenyl-phosphate glucose phosphotransferase [Butyrivibrio sp. VCD2006]
MIKDNQKNLNMLHVVGDGIIVACSYMLAFYLKFESPISEPEGGYLSMGTYFTALYFLVPAYMVLYNLVNLYTPRRATRLRHELYNILKANVLGFIAFIVALFMLKQNDFSRTMIAMFSVINVIFMSLSRVFLRKFLKYIRRKGYNLKHILLVGYSRTAEGYISRINNNPQWGYVVSGILDDIVPLGTTYHGVKVIAKISKLTDFIKENEYDEITITLPLDRYDKLEELVDICEKSGIHTKFIPDYTSLFPSNPYTEDILGLPVINIRYVPLTNGFNIFVKRIVDIVGSIIGMVVASPLMLMAAIAVKISSPGPIIFKQERVGLHGQKFMMYKFRTMELQNEKSEKKGWTTKDDPRVTKVGRFLRSTSIDELPQLWNVLIGDMSLIGPRPERPQFVAKFRQEIPRYMVKHQVRPGITGWAQINGYRGDTSIRKRIEFDIYYIENWSMEFDFRILVGTIFHGFINKNAY